MHNLLLGRLGVETGREAKKASALALLEGVMLQQVSEGNDNDQVM